LGAESNDGEVAAWTIYNSPDGVERLVKLFPECMPSGQAYALAVLCRLDKAAFQSLTNSFCRENGDIRVASGCSGWAETRTELLRQMKLSKSALAFHPSRPPRRYSSMSFRGDQRDVYELIAKSDEFVVCVDGAKAGTSAFATGDPNPVTKS